VLRKGTDAELTSSISHEVFATVRPLAGIARNEKGEPKVSPEGLSIVNLPSVDAEGMNVTVRGLLPMGLSMREKFKITEGRIFTPGLHEVIVGEAVAKRYPGARIGSKLRFGVGTWDVVGVFSVGESAANSEIWVDMGQFTGDFKRAGEATRCWSPWTIRRRSMNLKKQIEENQNLGATVISEEDYYKGLTNNFASAFIQTLGFLVAVIMAVGSAFAATNTMYAAVSRRTREIGILRALGFSRFAILMSFMLESIFLSLLGGIIGILISIPVNGMSTGVGNFTTFSEVAFKFKVGPAAILFGLLFATIIGAIGGFLPAFAAARKGVIQAMRDT